MRYRDRHKRQRRRLGAGLERLEPRLMLHGATDDLPHDHPPDYDLDNFHIHATLLIWLDGQQVEIPAGVGTQGDQFLSFIHTHDSDNVLHLHNINGQSPDDFIRLGEFFDTWRTNAGTPGNNPNAILSPTQLLDRTVDAQHSLQMFVNGVPVDSFGDYAIHDGDRILLVYSDNPVVVMETNVGPIVLELFAQPTDDPQLLRNGETGPVDTSGTVENFLGYVNRGDYQNMFFHRLQTDFVLQGGGFTTATGNVADIGAIGAVPPGPTIPNEPGVSNKRGTIAMARGSGVNSATSEFYFNLSDSNTFLDTVNEGFTVFGRVLDLATIDQIAQLSTQAIPQTNVFEARLDGQQEVPAVDTTASGEAALHFDPDSQTFDLDIFIAGIDQQDLTASHIHVGAPGTEGTDIFSLGDGSQWTVDQGGLRRRITGATFPAGFVQNLLDGNTYINVHTTAHPEGEIRGQLLRRSFNDASIGFPPVTPDGQFVFVESIFGQGTIRGRVFEDTNDNGVRDDGEPGMAGVLVFLDADGDGQLDDGERSTTTDANGNYFFHVPAGQYVVRQVTPPNFEQTTPLGPDQHELVLQIGQSVDDLDFGNDPLFDGVLSGFVYLDADQDGVRDEGERGIAGVTIRLSGTDDFGNPIEQTQRTAGDGSYRFGNLPPGDYAIEQVQPPFLLDGLDTIGSQGGTALNDRLTMRVEETTVGVENNFGERGRQAPYVLLRDFFTTRDQLPNFARRFDHTILAATSSQGQLWVWMGPDWDGFQSAQLTLSDDQSSVTLTLVDQNQQTQTRTLQLTDSRLVVLGRLGDQVLIRLHGGPSAFGLTIA